MVLSAMVRCLSKYIELQFLHLAKHAEFIIEDPENSRETATIAVLYEH